MKKIMKSIIAFTILFIFCSFASATTWYVRPSGGSYGAEDGTSYADAWDGITNITWGVGGVVADDTLFVCGDHTLTGSALVVGDSGSDGSPITIRFDYPSDGGNINANNTVSAAIRIDSYDYITIIGDRSYTDGVINNSTSRNIYVLGTANDIIIKYISSTGSNYGVQALGDNFEIGYCKIYSNSSHGISVTDSGDPWIHHNLVYNNGTVGTSNMDAIFVGNDSTGAIAEYNTIYGQEGSGGSALDASGDADGPSVTATFRYNILYSNAGRGISCSGDVGYPTTITCYCNIVYDHTFNFFAYEYCTANIFNNFFGEADRSCISFYHTGTYSITATFYNNICSSPDIDEYFIRVGDDYTGGKVTITSDYNCFYGAGYGDFEVDSVVKTATEWTSLTSNDSHSLYVEASFVDQPNNNYELPRDSVLIDAGTDTPISGIVYFKTYNGYFLTNGVGTMITKWGDPEIGPTNFDYESIGGSSSIN